MKNPKKSQPKSVINFFPAANWEIDFLFKQGFAHHQQGQLAQAKSAYEKILKKNPQYFDALNLLGVIAYQTHDHLRALALMDQAIAVNPRHALVHSNRGNVLQALGRFDEAVSSYDHAVELNPDLAETLNNRGNALQELKHFDEALACYNKAVELEPSNFKYKALAGIACLELNLT